MRDSLKVIPGREHIGVPKPLTLALPIWLLAGWLSLGILQASFADEPVNSVLSSESADQLRQMQQQAVRDGKASWGHWGNNPEAFSTWTNHSNRLIPVYTFGVTLDRWREQGSAYADPKRLERLYGRVPEGSPNPTATYYDQTDIYHLQQQAVEAGYRHIILMVFDGMDWQTTRAAALWNSGRVQYELGRGTGLAFLDERSAITDFGLVVTSPWRSGAKTDVDAQTVLNAGAESTGGYDAERGGQAPWLEQSRRDYLLGLDRQRPDSVTDSASSATSMTSGIKTYNGSINVAMDGSQVEPIARFLQREKDFAIGVVTSVPISHATPAAAYANNVTRKDYQDLTRDLLGLPSVAHRSPLSGVDVLIGAGWGQMSTEDKQQGRNFLPGNTYLHEEDIKRVDVQSQGRYVVAQRTAGQSGKQVLMTAAQKAKAESHRLLGFFGVDGGHLPFRTANGDYDPTLSVRPAETYSQGDLLENPTLAEMTQAALTVLAPNQEGFWLMIESGDVDWANHANNIDNSVGAVLSGDAAFQEVIQWVNANDAWETTAVIVTADHGHYFVLDDPSAIAAAGRESK